jgi:phage/plasmid-associated DNA primase
MERILDGSGALHARALIRQFTKDFTGREDRGLKARLMAELPQILNWHSTFWTRSMRRVWCSARRTQVPPRGRRC